MDHGTEMGVLFTTATTTTTLCVEEIFVDPLKTTFWDVSPPKTNMEPEITCLKKENHLNQNLHFRVSAVSFRGE